MWEFMVFKIPQSKSFPGRSSGGELVRRLQRTVNNPVYIHKFHSDEDLCTTVSIALKSNSAALSPVFVNILL